MKKYSLLFCLAIMMLFGFRSYATVGVTISTGLPTDTVCSGTSVTFTATPSGGGPYGYIWNLNGSYVGTSSSTYTTTSLLMGTDKIYCLLTNAAGDTIYALSDTLTMVVDSTPSNSPITGPTPTALCIGDTISLSDASSGGTWASSNTTAATVSSIGTVTGISLPPGGGFGGPSIHVYYIMSNRCGSDTAQIRVYLAKPASAITLASNNICLDSSISMTDSAGGGTWVSSDSTIVSVARGFGFPPPENATGNMVGSATITYSVTNACGTFNETTNITVINCDTLLEVHNVASLANGCNIYPNPSMGTFNIIARSGKYSQASCTVSNMLGEKVKEFTINTNKETAIDMGMPTGVYFINVCAGDEKYVSKIVIVQ